VETRQKLREDAGTALGKFVENERAPRVQQGWQKAGAADGSRTTSAGVDAAATLATLCQSNRRGELLEGFTCCAHFGSGLVVAAQKAASSSRGRSLARPARRFAIDADEAPAWRSRRLKRRPVREGFERFLELAKTRIHLIRSSWRLHILPEACGILPGGHRSSPALRRSDHRYALEPAVPVIMSVGKLRRHPATSSLGGDRLGFRRSLPRQDVRESDIFKPHAIFFEDRATRCPPAAHRPRDRQTERGLSEPEPPLVRRRLIWYARVTGLLTLSQTLFLRACRRDGERHQLLERHGRRRRRRRQRWGDGREPEPLLHHVDETKQMAAISSSERPCRATSE